MGLADPTFVIVVGQRGAGEVSVAQRISDATGWPYVDGDDFRAGSVAELVDGQRLEWLDAIGAWIDAREVRGDSAVVACPELSAPDRARLRNGRPGLQFLVLRSTGCDSLEPGEPGLELDPARGADAVLRDAMHELDLR